MRETSGKLHMCYKYDDILIRPKTKINLQNAMKKLDANKMHSEEEEIYACHRYIDC